MPISRWAIMAWSAALCALLMAATLVEFRDVASTLPYPQHVDEPAISVAAAKIITTGRLRPDTFNYPSLPKYIAAAGMAVGFVRGSTQMEISNVDEIGNVGFPYYTVRRPMETTRQTFVLISIVALALTGLCAWLALRRPLAILAAPLLVLATPLYFFDSWTYLNVDIVGTCCVIAAVAATLSATRAPSIYRSAILPAVFAGLAIGSKYTLVLVLAPVVVGLWLFPPPARVRATLVAIVSAVATFIAVVPYSVLDLPDFLNGLAYEGHHYANGQAGFDGTPGLPQLLFYLRHFVSEFGLAASICMLVGIATYARHEPRRAAVLLAFPVATLWLLVSERVHFTRNVLAIYPIAAIFAVAGFLWIADLVVDRLSRVVVSQRRLLRVAVPVLLALLLAPPSHVRDLFRDRTDARIPALAWLDKAIGTSWTIVVPRELGLDTRHLVSSGHKVVEVDLGEARTNEAAEAMLANVGMPSVILVPAWDADPYWPGQKRADDLKAVAAQWHPVKTFGTRFVQTNHENAAPDGSPAFGVAPLHLPVEWTEWLEHFDAQYRQ